LGNAAEAVREQNTSPLTLLLSEKSALFFQYFLNSNPCLFNRSPHMQITNNTIVITGGGSGIGRALAEKFHAAGNRVIIAGRNQSRLDSVAAAHPGMVGIALDIADAAAIHAFAARIIADYPGTNVLINNAGMMAPEAMTAAVVDTQIGDDTVMTNMLGTMRLSAALLPHLRQQLQATLMTVTSGLAFVPLAVTPAYCATKAGLHAWSMAVRHQLHGTSVQVIELAPPYVQTELMGANQAKDPNAMPLAAFIDEVMSILTQNPDVAEVIVDRCKPLRFAVENGNFDAVLAGLNSAFH
jgi:uncharacterized oxidoreductase